MLFTFHASAPMAVPPGAVAQVSFRVSGIEASITEVSVAVHVRHSAMDLLSLALVSPDSQTVLLSAFQGGSATGFGDSPTRPLVFHDEAEASITRAFYPPLVGAYRPLGKLATFRGLPPSIANGAWHLVVMDVGRTDAFAVVVSAMLFLRT
jgi:hypothetical protein